MQFINTLLFLVFCLAGLYFLFNEGRMISNPFIKGQKYFATGHQIFLIFTMATGMFMLGRFSATRLLIWIAYLFIGVIFSKGKLKYTTVIVFYALYILCLLASLFLVSPDKWYGIRVIAKYIYPIFVLMYAAKVTSSEFVTYSAIKYVLAVAIFVEITFIFWLPWLGMFWGDATLADHVVVMCAISLALFYATSKKKYLLLLAFFMAFPILFVNRTGLVGITACFSVFFLFRYKWRAAPVVFIVIAAAVSIVLYVPEVRDKMFRKQMTADEVIENRNELTMDDIDTNGRQAMWDWSLENFYKKNKIWGVGVGNLQEVFYSFRHPFGEIRIVHNDYIQILCDNGLVGLILYLLIGLSMVVHSFFIYNNKNNNEMIRLCAIVGGSTVIGIMCTSYTDNSVNYTFATYCYPFAFYGMALGLLRKYER